MLIFKIILYGVYWLFMLFTAYLFVLFVVKMITNIMTPPYYCSGVVINKFSIDKTRSAPKGGSFPYTVYNLNIETNDNQQKTFTIPLDFYWEINVGKRYEFYINNNDIKEYTEVTVD